MATAAELIAKIRVEGAEKAQSAFQKTGQAFSAMAQGSRNVLSDLKTLGSSVDDIADGFEKFALRGVKSLESFAFGLVTAGAALVIDFGKNAIEAAADFEQLGVTLETLTGSAEKAREKLSFIRRLDAPSLFTFKELAEAGVQVEAFGLNLERVLPLAAKTGAAFNLGRGGLLQFIRAFGEVQSGKFPTLMQLSRFGLSRGQFAEKGIQFDANGKLLSSTRQTMEAWEKIVNEKYGNILDKMANTTNARLATLRTQWELNMVRIGEALIRVFGPVIDRLTKWLENLGQDQNFNKFLKNVGVGMVRFVLVIAQGLAFFELAIAAIRFGLKDIAGGLTSLAAALAITVGAGAFSSRAFKFLKQIGGENPAAAAPVPTTDLPFQKEENPLDQIAANTKKTANNTQKMLDLSQTAFGGGPLGQMGVTPVELGGFNRSRQGIANGSIRIDLGGASSDMTRAMQAIVWETVSQLQRAGYVPQG